MASRGLGKSWLACALGQKACRENLSVLYTRAPRLFADLAIAHGDARYARLLRSLARVKLLILDDWGPEALTRHCQSNRRARELRKSSEKAVAEIVGTSEAST